jgi:predicted GIY-YIG superfamily endonuclease
MKKYYVYWIHHKNHKDIYLDGYVGKTNNLERRWKSHKSNAEVKQTKRNSYPLYQHFRKYGLENFEFVIIAQDLDHKSALNMEYGLRPCDGVGLNISAGGNFNSPKECSSLSSLVNMDGWLIRINKHKDKCSYIRSRKPNQTG